MDLNLSTFDYDAFFNRKADWHEELDQLTDSTRDKLKQVLFRMLREAELVSDEGAILPAILSQRLVDDSSTRCPHGVPDISNVR